MPTIYLKSISEPRVYLFVEQVFLCVNVNMCVFVGMLKKLTTLKVDDNQLTSLPNSIGR